MPVCYTLVAFSATQFFRLRTILSNTMARTCLLCGRGALNANRRSHSNIATAVRKHVNLQTLFLGGKRVTACTSCIRRETKKLKALAEKPVRAAQPATA